MSSGETSHITSYKTYGIVLVVLLLLTSLTILITDVHLGAFTVTVALLIACVKVGIVLTYFMHLKFESMMMKFMVIGVFVLFAIVVAITFIDYWFR